MFDDFGKILIRKPLLPYSVLFDENGQTKNTNDFFKSFLDNQVFIEAVFWSSIPFFKTLIDYKSGKILDDKKSKKILHTLKKYIIRSATRPTPFGIFAGISLQNISNPYFKLHKKSKRKLRIDVSILNKIIRSIENNDVLSNYLSYQINNTLYEANNQYRFLEIDKQNETKLQISSLEKNKILYRLLKKFKGTDVNFDLFYDHFKYDFEKDALFLFFKELVEMRFLISELELTLTAKDDFSQIKIFLDKIKNLDITISYNLLFNEIEKYIVKVEKAEIGEFFLRDYEQLIEKFKLIGILIKDEQIFQVDLIKDDYVNHTLSNSELKNIYESIIILNSLSSKSESKDEIYAFKKIFLEKYESKAVPLLEVLDVDLGIGFPANESIGNNVGDFFEIKNNYNEIRNTNLNLSHWLLDKIESLPNNINLEITYSDFKKIEKNAEKLPNTFYLVGQLLNDEKILIQNTGGVFGNTLFSRFTYLDPRIESLCNNISDFEAKSSPEVIFADIIWIDNFKVANISRRNSHIEYEIPVFYKSSKNPNQIISLNDLFVSIQNDEIILTSKKLRKKIIPRLSSAHNFTNTSNPIYNFLCSLQNQRKQKLDLIPDFKNSFKRFFPRIFYKNIILFSAHWIIHKSDINAINDSVFSKKSLIDYFKKWNVSQFVLLAQGDNELFIDTLNDQYIEILIEELKKNNCIILKELLINPLEKNNYITQFILPLKKKKPLEEMTSKGNILNSNNQIRNYFPGSEWVYFKIYCSSNVSNEILIAIYEKFILSLKQQKLIKQWFFIRYFDPHHHLRLRIKITSLTSVDNLQNLLFRRLNQFIKNELIWKIKIDTYQREIERYGVKNITTSETLFYHDSESFIYFLKNKYLDNVGFHIALAIKNINFWLSILNLDIYEKISICDTMKKKLSKEKTNQFLLDAELKFREYKSGVFAFMDSDESSKLIEKQNRKIKKLNLNKENIIDYIHMSVNRWFFYNQRDWEYLLYHFCFNYYSKVAYKIELK